MKRSELKKLIKPMVKDCIREVLLEEGLLSGIVSEVAKGLNTAPLIREEVVHEAPRPRVEKKRNHLAAERKMLLDAIGRDAYGGVDIFEGVEPAPPQQSPQTMAANPLANENPNDPGVDISGIFDMGGKNWKALMG
jgi:hypothetical protein